MAAAADFAGCGGVGHQMVAEGKTTIKTLLDNLAGIAFRQRMSPFFLKILAQQNLSRRFRCAVNPPHQRRGILDDVQRLRVETRSLLLLHQRPIKSGDVAVILHERVRRSDDTSDPSLVFPDAWPFLSVTVVIVMHFETIQAIIKHCFSGGRAEQSQRVLLMFH